jgi:adenylosuccinate lyase
VALWHERDISHSSVERIIFPDACHTLHHMLEKMAQLMAGLVVFPARMQENLERVRGLIYSQAVLLALTAAGVNREDAYAWVQRCALRVWDEDVDFQAVLAADPEVKSALGAKVLAKCFDPQHQLRNVDHIFQRTLALKDE